MKHRTAYQKATAKIEKEGQKQCFLAYGAAGIALWRQGKRHTAITRLFEVTQDVWEECANNIKCSMIQMCEEETGIEVQCGNGKSWHDLPYLNMDMDVGKYTNAQWVYMRQQQVKWIPAQVIACILVALHRKYKYGPDRCARFYEQVQAVQDEYKRDAEKVRKACLDLTGINVKDIVTEKREKKCG